MFKFDRRGLAIDCWYYLYANYPWDKCVPMIKAMDSKGYMYSIAIKSVELTQTAPIEKEINGKVGKRWIHPKTKQRCVGLFYNPQEVIICPFKNSERLITTKRSRRLFRSAS